MIAINETQRKIIHLLNDFGIDRISMAGILGTLEQDNLNENSFSDFIKNKLMRPVFNLYYSRALLIIILILFVLI